MSHATVVPNFEVVLPDPPRSKFEQERAAFYRLLPNLLSTHRGQYVAIHDEQVVESGSDRTEVVSRTLDRVRADIYVGLVTEEPQPVARSGVRRVIGERRPTQ
jgi:Family of unknown function (DUF5678)